MKGWDPTLTTVFVKILLDQLLFSPTVLFGYLSILAFANQQLFEEYKNTFRPTSGKYWQILFVNWRVWPIVNIINFRFVPVHLRVLFTNIVGYFWGIYLILQSSKPTKAPIEDKKKTN
jgi:hypothetical protein